MLPWNKTLRYTGFEADFCSRAGDLQATSGSKILQSYAELCKRVTGADPVLLEGPKDRLVCLLDCYGDGTSDPLAPGPTIRDYHNAYKTVCIHVFAQWLTSEGAVRETTPHSKQF
jgi:hypothetical protein